MLSCFATLLAACAREHGRDDATRDAEHDAAISGSSTDQPDDVGSIDGAKVTIRDARFGFSNLYLAELVATTGPHFELSLSEHTQPCGAEREPGQVLLIDLFDNPSAYDSRVMHAGDYLVWDLPAGPGNNTPPMDRRSVTTWSNSDGAIQLARGGMVVIDAVSSDALSGSFELEFRGGHLHGSFEATFCEVWRMNGVIPGADSR